MNNKKIFNKLVRDKIPEIIENNGEIPEIEVLDDLIYSKMLDEKLLEECEEVMNSINSESKIEEVADVLEVLHAIVDLLGINMDEVEKIRLEKQKKRGAFKNKILLKSTICKDE